MDLPINHLSSTLREEQYINQSLHRINLQSGNFQKFRAYQIHILRKMRKLSIFSSVGLNNARHFSSVRNFSWPTGNGVKTLGG